MKAMRLGLADAELYRELMLEGYASHPDAFTSTAAERAALPLSWWQARLTEEPGAAAIVLGVKLEAKLAGAVALTFESRDKTRHKSSLVGLYVRPSFRRLGLGNALVESVVTAARASPRSVGDFVRLLCHG